MRIDIENVAKVAHASVVIDGITVIAGENDTGKSTIGKVLYCFFNSFYNIERRLSEEKSDSLIDVMRKLARETHEDHRLLLARYAPLLFNELVEELVELSEQQPVISDTDIENALSKFKIDLSAIGLSANPEYFEPFANIEREDNRISIDTIRNILSISNTDLFKTILTRSFSSEFNGQINSIYNNSIASATLVIRESASSIKLEDNEVTECVGSFALMTEALYFDDPFIIDELAAAPVYSSRRLASGLADHRIHLESRLRHSEKEPSVFDEILDAQRLETIDRILNSVCPGELMQRSSRGGFVYKQPSTDKPLDARNLSSGLKTFAIIKELIMNGTLEENGTIIMDEPEIHLHPEWQLIFAEIIVLIQKIYGMHILLNTHSPYFLNAIQVYAAKHSIANRCRYYLAENEEEGSVVRDVTNDVDLIYQRLARPLQVLENESYSDEC